MAQLFGSYLTPQQVAQVAAQAGFTGYNLVTAVAVSLAEDNSGYTLANNKAGEDSRGLWQINVAPGAHPQLASLNLFDPVVNATQAFSISSGGSDWSAWTTYTSGKYKNYLNQASLAVASAGLGNFFGGISSAATTTLGTPPSGPLISIPNPVAAVTNAATNLTDPVVNAVNGLANVLGTGVNNISSSLAQLTAVGQFLGQPHFVERLLLLLGGGALLLIGLVLFALSFVKTPAIQVGV